VRFYYDAKYEKIWFVTAISYTSIQPKGPIEAIVGGA